LPKRSYFSISGRGVRFHVCTTVRDRAQLKTRDLRV
jgi:hypothetical protein